MSAPTDVRTNTALVLEFNNLKRAAIDEANLAVEAARRRNPQRFWASRMNQTSLNYLEDIFKAAYPAAIEKRFAQLDRINRKLTRCDPEWAPKTAEQLREVPVLLWRGQ